MILLIHFAYKYEHAQHVLAYVDYNSLSDEQFHLLNRKERILLLVNKMHRKLLEAVGEANIKWDVVRVFHDASRDDYDKIMILKKNKKICPVCNERWAKCAKDFKSHIPENDFIGRS